LINAGNRSIGLPRMRVNIFACRCPIYQLCRWALSRHPSGLSWTPAKNTRASQAGYRYSEKPVATRSMNAGVFADAFGFKVRWIAGGIGIRAMGITALCIPPVAHVEDAAAQFPERIWPRRRLENRVRPYAPCAHRWRHPPRSAGSFTRAGK
jgi:hypothetical protein